MDFNEKILQLRKFKGLTQEELADSLYVSRTAISKWESGRGFPSIDSLKVISKFFGISIDELLSGDELLSIAEAETIRKKTDFCHFVYGVMDCCAAMLFILPLFGQKEQSSVRAVSLLFLSGMPVYLMIAYYAAVFTMLLVGFSSFLMKDNSNNQWRQYRFKISVAVNFMAVILFIITLQPYAAVFLLVFLLIKALMRMKQP